MNVDIILGNPPFNLDMDGIKSQHFFSHKAYWLLNPGGLMLLVMPASYLASESARLQRRREKKGLAPGFSLIECLHELIGCVQCTGFWCGLFCGLFFVSSDTSWVSLGGLGLRQIVNRVLMLFCCGAAGSFLAPLGDVLLDGLFYSKVLLVRRLEDLDRRQAEEDETRSAPPQA